MSLGEKASPVLPQSRVDSGDPELALNDVSTSKQHLTMRQRLTSNVSTSLAYIPLLVCCFITGITDSTLYNAYGTFVSMQTGNTIFIALGASGQNNKPFGWARSLCSLGCFVIGTFVYSRMSAILGGKRRSTLIISFFFQTICVVLAAAVIQGGIVDGAYPSHRPAGEVDWRELIPVALLSFQAAGQIVNSRVLGVSEVPTVVITSLLCDLMSDPLIVAPLGGNPKRNKRFIAFTLTLVGGIVGGWISKATSTVQPALWVIAGIKFCLTLSWLFWPVEKKL